MQSLVVTEEVDGKEFYILETMKKYIIGIILNQVGPTMYEMNTIIHENIVVCLICLLLVNYLYLEKMHYDVGLICSFEFHCNTVAIRTRSNFFVLLFFIILLYYISSVRIYNNKYDWKYECIR